MLSEALTGGIIKMTFPESRVFVLVNILIFFFVNNQHSYNASDLCVRGILAPGTRTQLKLKLNHLLHIGFSLLVDPTWTLLGNVSCVRTQKKAVEILQWQSMGFSVCPIFYIEESLLLGRINHCFGNKSKSIPHTGNLPKMAGNAQNDRKGTNYP